MRRFSYLLRGSKDAYKAVGSAGRRHSSLGIGIGGVSGSAAAALLRDMDTFVFDCDGVIWKGDALITGADTVLKHLQNIGKNIFFMTNNSLKTRRECMAKFESFDIKVDCEQMLCSSFAAAHYLQQKGFANNASKKVYVIGEGSIVAELREAGIHTLGGQRNYHTIGPDTGLPRDLTIEVDPTIAAVVVGCDRYINYYKLLYGKLCLDNNPECLFIATNTDRVKHLTPTQEYVGAGAMVNALKGCTGLDPIITGKPSPYMIDYLVSKHSLDKSRMCMVGDRFDTDVLFGINGGIRTCLTLSGCTTPAQAADPTWSTIRADVVVDSIAALLPPKLCIS